MGLEFHAVVIHPTWVLGTEPGSSSARAVSALSAVPSLQLFSVLGALSQPTKWQVSRVHSILPVMAPLNCIDTVLS